ncbi:MAG: hypothetical protein ABSD98_03105 [Candidatus Korobacteraceae bacterium]|jgi:hypothetical protein
MRTAKVLLDLGGGIFMLLGLLHALYTYLDIRRPRRLVPRDPALAVAMAESQLRIARGGTTMWRAWVGFNFSHSLGGVVFGLACIYAGTMLGTMVMPPWILLILVAIAMIYLVLSVLYWFRTPTLGIVVAIVCLFVAWIMYASAAR